VEFVHASLISVQAARIVVTGSECEMCDQKELKCSEISFSRSVKLATELAVEMAEIRYVLFR
jgi:hypothetical protein